MHCQNLSFASLFLRAPASKNHGNTNDTGRSETIQAAGGNRCVVAGLTGKGGSAAAIRLALISGTRLDRRGV